ncbi:HDOD domain-containing protein [Nitrosophilus kaiyonis]|uniref:HDOD domain-containing protein n=1 Tax=Nitrosophilus kaiyonis TaxID=2930200 RepID=UPI00249036BF|nr:HDOD domain-containing protein [Nitrosophilus kaiyonis]
MKESIIKKIRSLPPLPKTIDEFERAYNDPNVSLEKIADILEKDPMIVANILKRVNSPYYGLRKEITDLSHAISLLGLSEVKGVVLQNSIKKLLNIDMEPYGVSAEEFANISHLQSHLMYRWYRKVDSRKLKILSLASLLQEMGKIVIADEIIKDDLVYPFRSEIETTDDIASVENSFVGTTTAEVTAEMFDYWGFDKFFVESIRYSDNFKDANEEVYEYSRALNIVKTAIPVNKPFKESSINKAINIAKSENMDTDFLIDAIESLKNT